MYHHINRLIKQDRQAAEARTLSAKAAACVVKPYKLGFFTVESPSGNVYVVQPLGGEQASCTCPAGQHGRLCCHVEAVRAFAAKVLAEQVAEPAPISERLARIFERIERSAIEEATR